MHVILITIIYILLFLFVFVISIKGKCKSNKCLEGKTAIVTGTSAISYETVLNLACRGCKVIVADITDASATVEAIIRETGNRRIIYKYLDFGSLESVRSFSQEILNSETRLDILILNASARNYDRKYTSDGLLRNMQMNYFGPFLLTHLVIDLLKETLGSRIVFVSSLLAFTHQIRDASQINQIPSSLLRPMHWDYGNSELCLIIASNIFARKLKMHGIKVNSVHQGWQNTWLLPKVCSTDYKLRHIYAFIFYAMANIFGKTPADSSQVILHCALSDDVDSAGFYVECADFFQPSAAQNPKLSKGIWKISEKLVKLSTEEQL